ncbi:dynein regulatory complex subunit 7-like [Salarias fasciatus]|uniref:dynein regulatory complex subunit 7-like n=1 Tax=Salarias fasciatus TaxID=181472 RepID=UPI001176AB7B|nr:dynein regulatory complex subunit 7-like [Salarias fasciatus]
MDFALQHGPAETQQEVQEGNEEQDHFLLLGADYDAYCVSGHAVQEMCARDQRQQDCPLLDPTVQNVPSDQKQQASKYTMMHQPELHSRYLRQQEEKRQEAKSAPEHSTVHVAQDQCQKPVDPLHGLRAHCWVLVLSGSCNVQENFFIDPLTGISYPTNHHHFLGIESIWNNFNYYVNMQDCKQGCRDLLFDLDDGRLWEPILSGTISRKDLTLDVQQRKQTTNTANSDEEEEQEERRVLKIPKSWVSFIHVTKEDLQRRYPGGKTEVLYRNAKLERFAPNVRPDGLMTRLSVYKEQESAEVNVLKMWYQHRNDQLQQRVINVKERSTVEHFKEGRPLHFLTYSYRALNGGWERQVEFSRVRSDHLASRVMTSDQMMETFEGRGDFLYHRHIFFSPHVRFSEQSNDSVELQDRPVQRVVERFHRNMSKLAHEDVNERVFVISERRIELKFHCDEHRLIPPQTKFIKPRESTEQQKAQQFTSDMVSCFQVDVCEHPPQIGHLYKTLQSLIRQEEQLLQQISMSQKEMRELVSLRQKEEQQIQNSAPEKHRDTEYDSMKLFRTN